jgi:hypothetical protein
MRVVVRPMSLRLVLRGAAVLGLAGGLAAQSRPASRSALPLRTALRETIEAYLATKPRKTVDVELDGALHPLVEVEHRALAALGGEAAAARVALAMADELLHAVLAGELRRRAWRFELVDAFERTIAARVGDAELKAHLERARAFFANEEVAVARLRFAIGPDGDAAARARAERAAAAARAGVPFSKLAKDADSLPDVPLLALNVLRRSVGESEYSELLQDGPVAKVVFAAREGETVGPLRGVDAWWVARVAGRRSRKLEIVLGDDVRELVRYDLVQQRFLAWADEVLARAVFRVHER